MNLTELLTKKKILVSDGATGTELAKRGLSAGDCPELWNVDHPDKVAAVCASYVQAGSDIILTNTFGGSRIKLQKFNLENRVAELNTAGVKAAKTAAAGTQTLVFASVGPSGDFMEPLGTITEQEMTEIFSQQITSLITAGADGIVIETMMSLEEAVCALRASKQVNPKIPVIVSLTYSHSDIGFVTLMGTTPKIAVELLTKNNVDVIGANCGLGTKTMISLTKELRSLTNKPLWIKPNAGLPELVDGKTVYRETPAQVVESISEIIDCGAQIVGGCCGFTPEHIKLVSELRTKKLA
jgi:5-methyltetrahydrofolate--homocysteine methyltransferase